MTHTTAKPNRFQAKVAKRIIPSELIYEEYDGKPMYYKGFEDVLDKNKSVEEIMGESDVQAILVGCLTNFLIKAVDDEKYFITSNEVGLHLKRCSNLSSDIVIYDKTLLQNRPITNKYLDIPPSVVIEIDIKADTDNFGISQIDYYSMKTKKLLDFGVKEVIWLFSGTKQQMIARPQQDWIISDWNKPINILEEYQFSIQQLLDKNGFKI